MQASTMTCPHCTAEVFRKSGSKLKASASIVVLHADGVEINCPTCKRGIVIPATINGTPIRKSERFVISKI